MAESCAWGAERSTRGLAVAIVARLRGYTVEHAYDQEAHRAEYDAVEDAILSELDCLNVPSDYAILVGVRVANPVQSGGGSNE